MNKAERMEKIRDFLSHFGDLANVELNQNYHTAYSLDEVGGLMDNLFFCGGVREPKSGGVPRKTTDADIIYKNYFAIDIDLRKQYALINGCERDQVTDEQLFEQIASVKEMLEQDPLLRQWSYIVFTGNGCHIYYCGYRWDIEHKELTIEDYQDGVKEIYRSWNIFTNNIWGEFNYFYSDNSTANIDRILRIPYSYNAKESNPGGRKIPVRILYQQNEVSDMVEHLKEYAQSYREFQKNINEVEYKNDSVRIDSGFMNAFVDRCNKLKIRDVLDKLGVRYSGTSLYEGDRKTSGWKIWDNGVNNFSNDSSDYDRPKGKSYSFVKKYLKHETRKETISWFKNNFKEIADRCVTNKDKFKKPEGELVIPTYNYSRQDKAYYFPSPIFDKDLGCIYKGELVTIVAEGNAGKTTFALDMILRNTALGSKCFYLNLEFPLGITFEKKWQDIHGKTKISMTQLSVEEKEDLDRYVQGELAKFDNDTMVGINIHDLIAKLLLLKEQGYELVFIDTFSKIDGNMGNSSWSSQNDSMVALQDFCGKTGMSIVSLHHTNKKKEFSGSKKIFDLSNMFITITLNEALGTDTRVYELKKDKNSRNSKMFAKYEKGEYILDEADF